MVGLIISLICSLLYGIAVIMIVGGFLILPFLIKGGWIFFVILIAWILCIGIMSLLEGENENEDRN